MEDLKELEKNNIINLIKSKNFTEAEKKISLLLEKTPYSTELHNFIGIVYVEQGKNDQAIISYNKSINYDKNNFKAYNNLGVLMYKLFKFKEAQSYYNKARKINPKFYKAINNLGSTLIFLEKFDEALDCFDQVIKNEPNNYEPYLNKGNILKNRNYLDDAVICFENALKINPNIAKIHNDYAITLKKKAEFEKAIYHFKKAIELDPNNSISYLSVGQLYKDFTQFKNAIDNYEKAISIKADYDRAYSSFLYTLSYMDNVTPEYYNAIGKKYRKCIKLFNKNKSVSYKYNKSPKKLKIGFVSGDFSNHSVGHFLIDLIKNLNSSSLELYAYNNNNFGEDDLKSEFKKYFNFWRNIFDKNDFDTCNIIREDGIHILIDLSGHTLHNRLPLFVNKPAPIQATWLGCNISSCIPEIDYIFGDKYAFNENDQKYFVEKIWHFPEVMQCLSKQNFKFEKKEIPSLKNNYITFGSFNTGSKFNDNLINVWSDILKSVKNSKLLLKSNILEEKSFKDSLLNKFKKNGINENSLIIRGRTKNRIDHLLMYNQVDITLDTFPYNGNTTSHESILMGVPVLTKSGSRPHSKIGKSLNINIDMKNWIANNEEEYVNKAVEFSKDSKKLSLIKKKILEIIFYTSSFDTIKFANQFEKEMWKIWKKNS